MDTRLLILAFGTLAGATDGFVIGSVLPAIARRSRGHGRAGGVRRSSGMRWPTAIGAPVLAAIFGARDRRLVLAGAAVVLGLSAIGIALAQGLGAGGRRRVSFLRSVRRSMGRWRRRPRWRCRRRNAVGVSLAVVVDGAIAGGRPGAPLGAGWRYLRLAAHLFRDRGACDRHRRRCSSSSLPKGLIGETRTIIASGSRCSGTGPAAGALDDGCVHDWEASWWSRTS